MGNWISVKDRPPEDDTDVLTISYGYNFQRVLHYDHGFNCHRLFDGTLLNENEITDIEYWMPLPELPAQREVA